MVREFSYKFSIVPSGEITDRNGSKKLGGAKIGRISSITMPSMVGIVGRAPAVDQKVWCLFFVCLSRFGNNEVCDNGNAMKQCNFQNSYGVIA